MSQARELNQFYTKPDVAKWCVEKLYSVVPDIEKEYDVFLEPSAGTGSFYYHLPANLRYGIDIDPKTSDIIKEDFFEFKPDNLLNYLVIGNPPFGIQSRLAVKFFNHAALFADLIAFVVPIIWQKWSIHKRLNQQYRLIFSEQIPDNSFLFESNQYHVPSVFQIWTTRLIGTDIRIRERPITTHDDFTFLPRIKAQEADFLMVVCGARKKLIHDVGSNLSPWTVERIRAHKPYVRPLFELIDWTPHMSSNTGTMWINRETIVREYTTTKQNL